MSCSTRVVTSPVDGDRTIDTVWIRRGAPGFWRANLALFSSGVATFGLLYCVQPLMPSFSHDFGINSAISALSLSVTTMVLAVAMLFVSALSDRWGRKRVMGVSVITSTILTGLIVIAPNWHVLLGLRLLLGVSLSGVPAVAMTWLSEEMHPASLGFGMGLFVSGNAMGGLTGRMLAGISANWIGWRGGMAVVAVIGLVAAVMFWYALPASRHFRPQSLRPRALAQRFAGLFHDRALPWLFAEGFMLSGAFVAIYNFLGYRLLAAPYHYSQVVVGGIFVVYLISPLSSTWMGNLGARIGRNRVLWSAFVIMFVGVMLTMATPIWLVLAGLIAITFGFFGGHSVASGWVGRRGGDARAQASSVYLLAYYAGSSVAGVVGGVFYDVWRWSGVAIFVIALLVIGFAIACYLHRIPPLPQVDDSGDDAYVACRSSS